MNTVTEVHLTDEEIFTFVGDFGIQVSEKNLTVSEFGSGNRHNFPRKFVDKVKMFQDDYDEEKIKSEPVAVWDLSGGQAEEQK